MTRDDGEVHPSSAPLQAHSIRRFAGLLGVSVSVLLLAVAGSALAGVVLAAVPALFAVGAAAAAWWLP